MHHQRWSIKSGGYLYGPPKSTDFFGELDNLSEEIVSLPGQVLICGDFNSWSSNKDIDIAVQLKTSLIEHDLIQHITSPTYDWVVCWIYSSHLPLNRRLSRLLMYVIWGTQTISLSSHHSTCTRLGHAVQHLCIKIFVG